MSEYNVLIEPWIPVVTLTGESRELGIRDVLLGAQDLSEVSCENPLETYAVQRFLIAFLMDAYRLPHASDRKKLFETGRFDASVIDGYIDLCRSEGVSFDLFDRERPFYQAVLDEKYDTEDKIKPVANLFHAVPSGNMPIHFYHRLAAESRCMPSQAFRALLSAQLFATAMTQGYPSSVNDTPCWYILLKGRNLFETLCLSMLSIGELNSKGKVSFDDPPPAWRDVSKEEPKKIHSNVSVLEGLTFRPRRITLLADLDGSVTKIYYQQGQSFHSNGSWMDPYVTYTLNKTGDYITIKPKPGRMPWRDVGAFALSADNGFSKPASIIGQSDNLLGRDKLRIIMLFGLASAQAKNEDWFQDSLCVPGEILFDVEKAESLRSAVRRVESIARLVFATVNAISNAVERTKDGKKKESTAADEAQTRFFSEMHSAVFTDYMPVLAKADDEQSDWEKEPDRIINDCAEKAAREIVTEYAGKLGSTARCIEVQTEQLRYFRMNLYKTFEERRGKEE